MKKSIKIYSFFIFILFLLSMEIWLGWGGRKTTMLTIFGGGALLVKIIYNIRFSFSRRNLVLVLLFYTAFLYLLNGGVAQIFTQIPSQLIPIICIVCIADEYKEQIMHYITKWYARLMVLSLLLYITASLFAIPGLGYLDFYSQSQSDFGYGTYINYLFYVKNIDITRFNGPFLEPGYVGMIGAFLLFANRFDLKKKDNKIILLSVLLSMSLAGWMLAFIGYMLNLFYVGRIKVSRIVFSLLFIVSLISFAHLYNNGENVINERILSRLEYDSDNKFSGNNRNSPVITMLAMNVWTSDINVLLYGYPNKTFQQYNDYELIGSGFDHFLVHNGLLGVLLVFSFYIYTTSTAKDKKFAILFLVFILFSFWQRCYALWLSWIICFYYSSAIADKAKYIKNKQL